MMEQHTRSKTVSGTTDGGNKSTNPFGEVKLKKTGSSATTPLSKSSSSSSSYKPSSKVTNPFKSSTTTASSSSSSPPLKKTSDFPSKNSSATIVPKGIVSSYKPASTISTKPSIGNETKKIVSSFNKDHSLSKPFSSTSSSSSTFVKPKSTVITASSSSPFKSNEVKSSPFASKTTTTSIPSKFGATSAKPYGTSSTTASSSVGKLSQSSSPFHTTKNTSRDEVKPFSSYTNKPAPTSDSGKKYGSGTTSTPSKSSGVSKSIPSSTPKKLSSSFPASKTTSNSSKKNTSTKKSTTPAGGGGGVQSFQGIAPSAVVESYSTEKLSKTGKSNRLDEVSDSKTIIDDYAKVWIYGITTKSQSLSSTDATKCIEYAKQISELGGLPQLRRLSIRDNDLVSTLTRAMGNDPSITSIKITADERFQNLCPSLVVGFAEALRTNIHITSITMTHLELGNDFLSAIAESITTNFTVQYINLSNNSFTNDALVDFCLGMEYNTTLQTVLLQNQQSPIFTLREDLAIEALSKNHHVQEYNILFQTNECNKEVTNIINRNKANSKTSGDYGTKLLHFLEKEAQIAEKRFQQRKKEAVAKDVQDSDMPFLYELSELAQQYKLPYDTNNDTKGNSIISPSTASLSSSSSNAKTSLAKLNLNLLSADGAFLNEDFITQYLREDPEDNSLTFEFTNESKIFKRFAITDPARAVIVTKFVDALVDHPKSNHITHLHMANTMLGNDFVIALRNRCFQDTNKRVLEKLHLINFETNYITGPGVTALAQCIEHPNVFKYLQAIKLDNQRHLISSDAEADLANALCVNLSVIKVSLRVRTLFERRRINNFVVRNIDFLRQARRWYGLKTGTIKERERNKVEKMFDMIAKNDPSITEVHLVSDQVFVSLSPEEVIKAAESFQHNKYVTKVKMSGLRLDDKFAITLGSSLLVNKSIEKLDVESNSIGSDGMLAIIGALRMNRTITELLLRHQAKPIASTDEEKIPNLIESNDTIMKLSVDVRSTGVRDNVDKLVRLNQERKRKETPKKTSTDSGKRNRIQQLFDKIAINDSSITEVEIVNDQVFICLNEADIEKAARSFVNNTHVTKIKMSGLNLNDKFGIAFAESLTTNTTIEKIDLERNAIGTDGISAILQSLSTNRSILELFVRYQSKPISSPDEEKIPEYLCDNNTLIKLSIDIRSVGARSAIDKKIRVNQEIKRKSGR